MLGKGQEVKLRWVDNLNQETIRIRHFNELAEKQLPMSAKISYIEGGEQKTISSTAYIKKVAKTVKDRKIVLAVKFENQKFADMLRKGMKILFEYSDSSSGFRFTSEFMGWASDDIAVILMPDKVETKRREMYRVKPHPKYPIEIEMNFGARKIKGTVEDINEKGVGIRFQTLPFQLKRDDTVRLFFYLPQSSSDEPKELWEKIFAEGSVRSVREVGTDKVVGIEFVRLDEGMREKIRKYWLMRQREEAEKARFL